jgi:hypothetical protein
VAGRIGSIRAPLDGSDSGMRRVGGRLGAPSLKAIDPAAARWIGAFIRISAAHPAMTRILDVIERLQDRPFRTNFLLTASRAPARTGWRARSTSWWRRRPLVRLDVSGFPEEAALEALCGSGRDKAPPRRPIAARW